MEVLADASADSLLDMAEEHENQDREDAADAVMAIYDDRYGRAAPHAMREARRAMLLGGQRWRADDHEGTAAAWGRAIDLFTEAGSEIDASVARGRLGVSLACTGRPDEGRALVEPDTAYQQEHGDARRRAAAWSRLSLVNLLLDRPDEANEAHDKAERAAAETGDARLAAFYLARRASNRAAASRNEEALAAATEARAYFLEHGPAARLADASVLFGQLTHDPEQAVTAFGEVLAAVDPEGALTARLGRGRALVQLERAAEAVDDLVEAVALCTEQDLDEGGAFVRQELADAYRQAGRVVEAAEVGEEALATFERLGHDEAADNTRFLLAGLYRELGDSVGSLVLYEALVERLGANLARPRSDPRERRRPALPAGPRRRGGGVVRRRRRGPARRRRPARRAAAAAPPGDGPALGRRRGGGRGDLRAGRAQARRSGFRRRRAAGRDLGAGHARVRDEPAAVGPRPGGRGCAVRHGFARAAARDRRPERG
nr:hypothetical protein GCM10020092_001960 [Actinoplanes digitatis]